MQGDNGKKVEKEDLSMRSSAVSKLLEELPEDKRDVVLSAIYSVRQSSYSGPLPPPEDFASYERVLAGSTDRILTMAEEQQKHRLETEKKIVDGKLSRMQSGQTIGCLLVAMFGVFAFVLALCGHDDVAIWLGVTTVISIAIVFVLNKMPSHKSEPM